MQPVAGLSTRPPPHFFSLLFSCTTVQAGVELGHASPPRLTQTHHGVSMHDAAALASMASPGSERLPSGAPPCRRARKSREKVTKPRLVGPLLSRLHLVEVGAHKGQVAHAAPLVHSARNGRLLARPALRGRGAPTWKAGWQAGLGRQAAHPWGLVAGRAGRGVHVEAMPPASRPHASRELHGVLCFLLTLLPAAGGRLGGRGGAVVDALRLVFEHLKGRVKGAAGLDG